MPRKTLQHQFREKIGEVAYTSSQISDMLVHLNLHWYGEDMIRKYVKEHDLTVNAAELGLGPSFTAYWIPKSNLTAIIQGLDISVTASQLEDAAYQLGYQI